MEEQGHPYLIRYDYVESGVAQQCAFICQALNGREAAESFSNQHPGKCFHLVSVSSGGTAHPLLTDARSLFLCTYDYVESGVAQRCDLSVKPPICERLRRPSGSSILVSGFTSLASTTAVSKPSGWRRKGSSLPSLREKLSSRGGQLVMFEDLSNSYQELGHMLADVQENDGDLYLEDVIEMLRNYLGQKITTVSQPDHNPLLLSLSLYLYDN